MEKQKSVAQGTGSEPGIPPDFLCGSEKCSQCPAPAFDVFGEGQKRGQLLCLVVFVLFCAGYKMGAKNITCKALCQSQIPLILKHGQYKGH